MPTAATVCLGEPRQESLKATSPTANVPDTSQDDVGQEKITSSLPLLPPQEPHVNIPIDPTLQGITSTEAPGVQSGVLQQPLVELPKARAVAGEGQTPTEAVITEESRATDGRSDTPPADDPPFTPLGPTLSQIIRNAANENARRNVIDLTFEKSDDDRGGISPRKPVDKPVSTSRTNDPLSASSAEKAVASLPPSTPSTVRTIDFSSIRKDRKVHLRTPQLNHSSPVKIPIKLSIPPLPRNVRRVSAPDVLKSTPLAQAMQPSATTSIPVVRDPGTSRDNASSVPPASATFQKLVLPRRPQVMRTVRATQSATSGSLDPSRTPTAPPAPVPEDGMVVDSGLSTSAGVPPLSPTMPSGDVESPPHSASPHTDASEEEECHSLTYPSTTPEESPEAEVPDEDEFPIRSIASRRTRSQASSEASFGLRRSARLSSSSASSSMEPEDLPRPHLRRRERIAIRTSSDDDIASQGGISRFRTRYSRAFEAAGFESLSWKKDQQRMAKEFAPVTQSAENIPHDLHDRLNALPPSARHASNLQAIFEAEIAANTAEDEPNAPPIRVTNDVDDEPTPPMEFYYSNLMWHSTEVPRPDFDALKGCGCVGACNPNSKTCTCVQRQKEQCDKLAGFLYQKGKLISHEYPIFECNINCGCSDDCPNRVIQHGRRYEIAIRKTASKGWGIFAGPKKIPGMSFIGVYAGEYLTDEEGEKRGLLYNSFGRTYLFDLDFYHINKGKDNPVKYTVDAYHAGNFTRYLNHSCDPNCAIVPGYINESNIDKPLLTIFTIRDVEPYEELCFDYNGASDDPVDPSKDGAVYVTCQCGTTNCKGYVWK
ncbi:histone methyltransferase [Ganoderma sinense ZZ0214-1]|uniref:Histone methyltransferase n=1 Tax=Ganoderma sinense ZZ0214-1 TaxID=1077348 RepID=A0A2G8SQT4_9APHY|nr:histone methyltransferase [Ganoderma sinense ZZ0214-1]